MVIRAVRPTAEEITFSPADFLDCRPPSRWLTHRSASKSGGDLENTAKNHDKSCESIDLHRLAPFWKMESIEACLKLSAEI